MSHSARKRAWSKVDDTCPHVDDAFSDMQHDIMQMSLKELTGNDLQQVIDQCVERVKEQTTALRNALIEAYEEMEGVVRDMEYEHAKEVAYLQRQIDSLS